NLHITTKFIGEWPEPRLPELHKSLDGVSMRSIPVEVRGLGFFPNRRSPRGFYAGVDAPNLSTLAGDAPTALAKLGDQGGVPRLYAASDSRPDQRAQCTRLLFKTS